MSISSVSVDRAFSFLQPHKSDSLYFAFRRQITESELCPNLRVVDKEMKVCRTICLVIEIYKRLNKYNFVQDILWSILELIQRGKYTKGLIRKNIISLTAAVIVMKAVVPDL